jgi:hypothetical protein
MKVEDCGANMHGLWNLTSPGPNLICRTGLHGSKSWLWRHPKLVLLWRFADAFLRTPALLALPYKLFSGVISSQARARYSRGGISDF